MRKQKWTPKKIHTYRRALIQLLFFLFLPSAFTTAFSGIKTSDAILAAVENALEQARKGA